MNAQLQPLVKKLGDAIEEARRIDLMALEAKAEIEKILADGKVGAGEEQRYATSSLTLQMLPSRSAYVAKALRSLATDLAAELAVESDRYDRAVAVKRAEARELAKTALAPFFEGEAAQLTRFVERMRCPRFSEIDAAVAERPFKHSPDPGDILTWARRFISRSSELAKKFDLGF